eukprot:CAMPEP_0198251488 /NCGR_PEP_ID=MMETSP1447-20131203/2306_1 /TAXON_ID=420782 /ORGANISM="Chaetoceros dichaeta, Strain CCMP1751" /LENGTH=331 /DNA_ID=CAMNT_0043936527 /DNA_START=105 /DNA_END=1100 /DNA_ORIENTATION=+
MENSTSTMVADAIATGDETEMEYISDVVLGVAFLIIAIVAAQRMAWSNKQDGTDTSVVTAFYSLILCTSTIRSIWFLIPNSVFKPTYVPDARLAFSGTSWIGVFLSEIILSLGSLGLFSIFILILVYWADILKKYFQPGETRSKPMKTFKKIVFFLFSVQILNAVLFLNDVYSSEAMRLVDAILLASVSIICVIEITIFSHKFRTVLQTLGAINQVSTESQNKRIVWITVTGNLFFFTRAFLEIIFTSVLIIYWHRNGNVAETFSHKWWDVYVLIKHWSEVAILALMLYILQSRFTTNNSIATGNRDGYNQVPEAEEDDVPKNVSIGSVNV